MSKPSAQSLKTSVPLTDLSVLLMNDDANFVAPLMPMTGVDTRKGLIRQYSQADLNRIIMQLRAGGTEAKEHDAQHSCGGNRCMPKCSGCNEAEAKCSCASE